MKKILVILALVAVTISAQADYYDEYKFDAEDLKPITFDKISPKHPKETSKLANDETNTDEIQTKEKTVNDHISEKKKEVDDEEDIKKMLEEIFRGSKETEHKIAEKEEGKVSLTTERVDDVLHANSKAENPKAVMIQTTSNETGSTGPQYVSSLGTIMEYFIRRAVRMEVRRIAAEMATEYLNANRLNPSTDATLSSKNGVYSTSTDDKVSVGTLIPIPLLQRP